MKSTVIVSDAAAASSMRLSLARDGACGMEVRTMAQVAARLAGGFVRLVETETLHRVCAAALAEAHPDALGDLAAIAPLPGSPGALAATLRKAWDAGIDLQHEASRGQPRAAALARLEASVLERLPAAMLPPAALVGRALARQRFAPAVLGRVTCRHLADLAPCWRPLLAALAKSTSVTWKAGPRAVPTFVAACGVAVTTAPAATPGERVVSCATARHEVIEALRWARALLAAGAARAEDIAIAAAAPGEFDDLMVALAAEANLPVHFAHGRRALTTRPGQAAASLADILLHGLSQERVRRLVALAGEAGTPLGALPEDWARSLPPGAPLPTPPRWRHALSGAPEAVAAALLPAIDALAAGLAGAEQAGEALLRGQARLMWRAALAAAPASALEASLGALRLADGEEPGAAIGWMHAATLAACPRPHVWLLGLNARTWPRPAAEDPLLPDHILPRKRLDWLPVTQADRLAFGTIRATTAGTVTMSASRRDATGRLIGLSPLLPRHLAPERLRRTRIPAHAMSEQDRMMARPAEFAGTARAASTDACWQDWRRPEITPHDGLVRPDHPALVRALDRVHSASSLKLLLRNPLGFVWRYALGWREPEEAAEPMNLDALQFGELVHAILDAALSRLATEGGRVQPSAIAGAISAARHVVAEAWAATGAVPPAILWAARLVEAEDLACKALAWDLPALPGQRSYGELSFGSGESRPDLLWDTATPVPIPGTGLAIRGRIDRLDVSGDGRHARVVDYKTGKPRDPGVLAGGGELQRCLYAFAAQALLGPDVTVEAALLYPRADDGYHPLADQPGTLAVLIKALKRGCESLLAGLALAGPDTGGDFDAFRFALPAATGSLAPRKSEAARAMLGAAAAIWEAA